MRVKLANFLYEVLGRRRDVSHFNSRHARLGHSGCDYRLMPSVTILQRLLAKLTAWILTLDVGSNRIIGAADIDQRSIFINGNLARVLLASYKLTGNAAHLNEGLRWCDSFVDMQHTAVTHDWSEQCGWWDTGYDELYIADTGTAVTTLAVCHDLKPKATYFSALKLFEAFVRKGIHETPTCYPLLPNKTSCSYCEVGCDKTASGYIAADGGLGDGYYKGRVNTHPYTIATALSGGVFYAEMHALANGTVPRYLGTAQNAVDWLLHKIRSNGTIPYIIDPPTSEPHEFQSISYSTEAFIDLHLRASPEISRPRLKLLNATVQYILRSQANGTSGALLPQGTQGEIQRSSRAASLLQLWLTAVDPTDATVAAALDKYLVKWLGSEAGFKAEGLNNYALSTGFVGLVLADMIAPSEWVTFVRWRPSV